MSIDVNDIREADSKGHGIPLCDDIMTFFYDETGNCGKFSLNENGVNDETALQKDFILGGVAYDGSDCPADAEKLIKDLKLKSEELKFKNICRTKDFMMFLGSERANIYIDWLYNSGLYIHYATINNLYFALVDIVDSLWDSQPQFAFSYEWVMMLKSSVYSFCKEHLSETLYLLKKYNYPNIERDKKADFCVDFCSLIETFNDDSTLDGFYTESFRQMLKYTGRHGELVFLYDNEKDVLVKEYYTLYAGRCYTYKNATHYFDNEKVIHQKMEEVPMLDNGVLFVNYEFIDSKENLLIQVSDVFVGLLSKLFQFLDSTTFEEISKFSSNVYTKQLINLAKINKLIIEAEKRHTMMLQNVNGIRLVQERMEKLQMLIANIILP